MKGVSTQTAACADSAANHAHASVVIAVCRYTQHTAAVQVLLTAAGAALLQATLPLRIVLTRLRCIHNN
jgi:hypothetical protein